MMRFFLTALLVLTMACPLMAKTYNVSVNQFVEHPSLDAVLQGFKDSLKAHGVEAKYSVHNAKANMDKCNQIAASIAAESPDLVLAIATPSAQACAVATKKSPILAGSPLCSRPLPTLWAPVWSTTWKGPARTSPVFRTCSPWPSTWP
jgi:putative tryptophan/tyrosine transport system substrate-binding protein